MHLLTRLQIYLYLNSYFLPNFDYIKPSKMVKNGEESLAIRVTWQTLLRNSTDWERTKKRAILSERTPTIQIHHKKCKTCYFFLAKIDVRKTSKTK